MQIEAHSIKFISNKVVMLTSGDFTNGCKTFRLTFWLKNQILTVQVKRFASMLCI